MTGEIISRVIDHWSRTDALELDDIGSISYLSSCRPLLRHSLLRLFLFFHLLFCPPEQSIPTGRDEREESVRVEAVVESAGVAREPGHEDSSRPRKS